MGKVTVNTADFESVSQFLTNLDHKLSNVYSTIDYVEGRIDYRVRNGCSSSFSATKSLVQETSEKNSKVIDRANLISSTYSNLEISLSSKQEGISKIAGTVSEKAESIFDSAKDFFGDLKEKLEDTGADILDSIQSFLEAADKSVSEAIEDLPEFLIAANEVINKVNATKDNFLMSLAEGVASLGEAIFDLASIIGTVFFSTFTSKIDRITYLYSSLTGSEWKSITDEMWDGTKAFVSKQYVKSAFDEFYESDPYGRFIKQNSYAFDTVRGVGNGVGYTLGIVGLSILTFGVGGALVSGSTVGLGGGITVSGAQLGLTAGAVGIGKNTEKAWKDGAGTLSGLAYGAAAGAWEGIQFAIGAKIGGMNIFGSISGTAGKIANSGFRVIADAFDGGIEGVVQPFLDMIYKGNASKSFSDNYVTLFNEAGGFQNIFTQALVGGGSSVLGEVFDVGKYFKPSEKLEYKLELKSEAGEESIFDDIADAFHKKNNDLYKESKKKLNEALKNEYKGYVTKKEARKAFKKLKFFDNYDEFWRRYELKNDIIDQSIYGKVLGVAYDDEILISPKATVNEVIHELNHLFSNNNNLKGITQIYLDENGNSVIYRKLNEGYTEYLANKISGDFGRGFTDIVERVAMLDDILTMVYGENNGILQYEYFNNNPCYTRDLFEKYLGEGSYDKFVQYIDWGSRVANSKTKDINVINYYAQKADEILHDLVNSIEAKQAYDSNRFVASIDDDLLTLAKARLSEEEYAKYVDEANNYGYINKQIGNKLEKLFKDVGYSKSKMQSLGYEIGIHDTGYLEVDEEVLNDIFNKGLINNGHSMEGVVLENKIPDVTLTVTKTNDFIDFVNRIKKANKYKNSQGSIIFKIPDGMSSKDIQYFDGTSYRVKPEYIVGFTRVDSNGNVLEFIENPNSLFKDIDNYSNNYVNKINEGELSVLGERGMDIEFSKYSKGRYGTNQGIIRALIKANATEKIELIVENLKKYLPDVEEKEILKYLNDLDTTEGICDYAMVSNIIFDYFSKDKKKFKEIFGYDYEYVLKNGKSALNDFLLLSELHLFLNKDALFESGNYSYKSKVSLTTFFRGKKETFKYDYLEKFLNFKGMEINSSVTPIYNNSYVEPWQYKPDLNGKSLGEYLKKQISKSLSEGKYLNLNISGNMREFVMTDINGKKYSIDMAHAMYITGIEDDKIILDSWGEKFIIPISDLEKSVFSIYQVDLSPSIGK